MGTRLVGQELAYQHGKPVKNKDLWEALLGEVERWSDDGVGIKFWLIRRNLNAEADRWAREAAPKDSIEENFREIEGVLV